VQAPARRFVPDEKRAKRLYDLLVRNHIIEMIDRATFE
jgi:hypothetical protein